MRIVTVVGVRPQFIKAAPVCEALKARGVEELVVHTGQHYDPEMSDFFFEELGLPQPHVNLGVGSGSHANQTARCMVGVEEILLCERPDAVLVYGDTNSTLGGGLAAIKLGIPLAHVEAGLRSFNRTMPEEHNRVLVDHCSDSLFCPTQRAVRQLQREGITDGVFHVGDTMYDAVLRFIEGARERSKVMELMSLEPQGYVLVTLHRNYNVDEPAALCSIVEALGAIEERVVFPVHPRTEARLSELTDMRPDLSPLLRRLDMVKPIGYFDMLVLQENASVVLTDSGGMQKECYFLRVPAEC